MVAVFVLMSLAGNAATVTQEPPNVFCAESWNWLVLAAPPFATDFSLTVAPPGAQLSGTGVLWRPAKSDLGFYDLRYQYRLANGQVRQVSRRFEVKPLRHALFVFAHQDDEFGIMPKILDLHRQGVDCHLVWMNGGNETRNQESRVAMALAGFPATSLEFLRLNGIENPQGFAEHAAGFQNLLKQEAFDQVYVPAYEGGHLQHDLVHAAVVRGAQAAGFRGMIYEFGLYHLEHNLPMPFSLLPAPVPTIQMTVNGGTLDLVQRMAACHHSQWPIVYGFVYGMSRAKKTHPEYRPLPAWDYSRPPTKGWLWYEASVGHPASFAQFRQAVGCAPAVRPGTMPPIRWAQDVAPGARKTVPDQPGQAVVTLVQPYSALAWLLPVVLIGMVTASGIYFHRRFQNRRRKSRD